VVATGVNPVARVALATAVGAAAAPVVAEATVLGAALAAVEGAAVVGAVLAAGVAVASPPQAVISTWTARTPVAARKCRRLSRMILLYPPVTSGEILLLGYTNVTRP